MTSSGAIRTEEIVLHKSRLQAQLTDFQNKAEEIRCELNLESNHLTSLIRVQQDLLQSFLAVVPIIEEKDNLERQLSNERKQLKEAERAHQEKLAAKKKESEVTLEELEKKFETRKKEALEKAKKAELSYEREVSRLEEEIKLLDETSKRKKDMYLEKVTALRYKYQKEQECLEKRIKMSKEHQSSQLFSEKDQLNQKVHAFELEYIEKLRVIENIIIDCNTQNVHLKEELRTVKESLKHQKLLNVVRDVATWPRKDTNFPIAENNQIIVGTSEDTSTAGQVDIIDETTKISETEDMEEQAGEYSSNQSTGSLKRIEVRKQPRRAVNSKGKK
ncbi:centrosomal protein of 128 kDa-like isoform X2 [Palaemon carinicauda]|uniref:centrosomal protein of 128 kDa-like isoform X2 n=1 Tax=Palaemon carinicauda TaxID=392227 RepID=UPI0035B5D39B